MTSDWLRFLMLLPDSRHGIYTIARWKKGTEQINALWQRDHYNAMSTTNQKKITHLYLASLRNAVRGPNKSRKLSLRSLHYGGVSIYWMVKDCCCICGYLFCRRARGAEEERWRAEKGVKACCFMYHYHHRLS